MESAKRLGKRKNPKLCIIIDLTFNYRTIVNKTLLCILLFISTSIQSIYAQVGGEHVYEFLNLSSSARVTGLGGLIIAVQDDSDVALGYNNPAALNPSVHNALAFNYNFYLADINTGFFSYGYYLKKWDISLSASAKFINYGEFDRTNIFGQIEGTFKANETALILGASKRLYERLTIGVNGMIISSRLAEYSSFGINSDVGLLYADTSSQFNVALVAKNLGRQLTTFDDESEFLPFDLQIGISKRLKHLPFRWSIIYHDLQRWNITFDDPNAEENSILILNDQGGDNMTQVFFDNLARHFVVNGEFLFGKRENFRVRLGYNHLRKRELSVTGIRSTAGFAFGLGLKFKRFGLEYGHGFYHVAGGSNHLSISTNLDSFKGGL